MATIADRLTNAQKGILIEKSLNVGDVYRMKLTEKEGITPKEAKDDSRNKYFIIVGKDSEGNAIGFVVINSNINPKLATAIRDLHYPILSSKYAFLEKDRFVNCANLKTIEKDKFSTLFDGSKSKGKIQSDDMEYIIGALQSSPMVEPKLLKRFGLAAE